MPTAVLDLELERLPDELTGLDEYARALVLLRYHGHPVAQAMVPIRGGHLSGDDLRDVLLPQATPRLAARWAAEFLESDGGATAGAPRPTATVAVCTRDRPDDLAACLDALLRLPDDGQEIVVVDNRPATATTADLVAKLPRVRYLREDRPGLSAARNRALREARGEVVAFTDDDAVPDAGWLRALLRNFDHPLVLCVTGFTLPLELETEAQEWFEHHSSHGRGLDRQVFAGTRCNPLAVGRIGAGVNMAVRRRVLDELGPFDEALGAGTPARAGEDYDMFSRILGAGYRIVYDPAALVRHRHRRSWQELRATVRGYGTGVAAALTRSFLVDREWSAPRIAASWIGWQIKGLIRALLQRPGSSPAELIAAELAGCVAGPRAYTRSRAATAPRPLREATA